ncbi:hypothetical protein HYH02_004509 [Chlamydomonas schloesseri]|uniref:NIF system FeS cluster assembly NifU C-terminal domain-containing protein n=1 Tax=Chlamydomonas schloesseri TaxID=2026947 RepID=A0A836B8V0_9CHLO|nr:hypothetical protein HYH02_004509 [Chlamydomonas schloesseri]|eukprot:KAG2450669.1 hypothetical protein HYH02_004509 [Chlamydomonas schloesseri]
MLRSQVTAPVVGRRACQGASQRPVAVVRGLVVRTHATAAPPAPIDDKTVPDGHKGLHNYLYSGDADKEHEQDAYEVRRGEDEGAIVMPVPTYLDSRDGDKPLGVYCVYDAAGAPAYIGYSRNMVLAIKGHLARVGPARCAAVRAMVYGNRAMASRANLERGVDNWVEEQLGGVLPPGNADPQLRALWEGTPASGPAQSDEAPGAAGAGGGSGPALDVSHMSPAERAAYEEKRTKLRKAMGEKMVEGDSPAHHHHDEELPEDPATRRAKLMKAMDRGDWSAVIDQQTKEAVAAMQQEGGSGQQEEGGSGSGSGGPAATASTDGAVQSPFLREASMDEGDLARERAAAGRSGRSGQELSVEAVTAALDEIRPYLEADGGDVEVVEVENGVVYLRLQGACSSCPSQSATMKGGIERAIRNAFGDQVRDILQLDAKEPAATVEAVDRQLDMLRGAIANLGGSVTVLSVEGGVATLKYVGPPAIGKGISGAVKDTFKDLKEVRLV